MRGGLRFVGLVFSVQFFLSSSQEEPYAVSMSGISKRLIDFFLGHNIIQNDYLIVLNVHALDLLGRVQHFPRIFYVNGL